ncbi:hypothetical protein ACGFJ7_43515 [Actinoplanes sp. NPDC048988]|uniref:hypothetical protein n=1 Tax=Actinoplanes sp. NPDC048988 TaxID=3363901 RepID=UPI0037111FB8
MSERPLSRRNLLALAATAGVTAALGSAGIASAAPRATARTPFRASLSVSPFTEAVLAQTVLRDASRQARTADELQRLFVAHGANEVFVRVATRPVATDGDAEHGITRALRRAALARRIGLPLNVELGLWNVYGDISHQPEPKPATPRP